MKVRLTQIESHAPWQVGELVTVQIASIADDGSSYVCDSLETFPPDLKERHAAQISAIHVQHQTQLEELAAQHAEVVAALSSSQPKPQQ